MVRLSIAAILLAAGESSRMGRPKQLLDWGGQPLVAAQTAVLRASGCRPVIVVLGAYRELIRRRLPAQADMQVVTNYAWRSGRASSIRAGARGVPAGIDAVVIASVDQPTTPAIVARTVSALAADPQAQIAVPRYGGQNGHPPIVRSELLTELQQVTEQSQGLRSVRRRYADRTIFLEMDDPLVTLNVNTPEAYRRAVELL